MVLQIYKSIDAVNAGANALGFVFFANSPRYITPLEAKKIVDKLPPFIQAVGLFVNENESFINEVCIESKMQLAQIIDDNELLNYDLLQTKYIKVIRVKSQKDLKNLNKDYYLVDAFVDGFGGVGKRVALEWFDNIDCSRFVLAGGLTSHNLKEINGYGFYGVDVSSGVEESKGKKSKQKMIEFVKEANEIN